MQGSQMENDSSNKIAVDPTPSGRRSFLRWLAGILSAVAASVLSIPVVGYFFGWPKSTIHWVDLGSVADFP